MNRAYEKLVTALQTGCHDSSPREIHIVGITGTEGTALAELASHRLGSSVTLIGHDFSDDLAASFEKAHVSLPKLDRRRRFHELGQLPQLEIRSGENYLDGLDKADVIFVGQNWRAYEANHPRLFDAYGRVPFAQMMDLYLDLAPCHIVGLTGTNGKTTTCNWLQAMAAPERTAMVSGNDLFSQQSLSGILEMPKDALLILEMSNRQLRDVHGAPPIAAVTSLAPDHIAEHGSAQDYYSAKRRIVELQDANHLAVLNYDDENVRDFAQHAPGDVLWASLRELPEDEEGGYLASTGELRLKINGQDLLLCKPSELSLPGRHNMQNCLIAAVTAYCAGVSIESIRQGAKEFTGVKNRLQLIAKVNDVQYFNDLASTTPWSTIAALKSFPQANTHVILGGKAKAKDGFSELAHSCIKNAHHLILLPGTVTEKLLPKLGGNTLISRVETIDEAVQAAFKTSQPGDRVLLSPAGAGFYTAFLGKHGSFNRSVRRLQRHEMVA